MRAMVLGRAGEKLSLREVTMPVPGAGQVLRVRACGVCRTDLHVVDGELDRPKLPLVPGHQIVGACRGRRSGARRRAVARLDVRHVPLLRTRPREPLRPRPLHRLRHRRRICRAGGRRRALLLPASRRVTRRRRLRRSCAPGSSATASLRLAGDAERSASTASARPRTSSRRSRARRAGACSLHAAGRPAAQDFARELGAVWAGDSGAPPEELDAAIIFAPVGALVPAALRAVAKGGAVVCAGIHMSDIPRFPYELLWGERTRALGREPHAPGRRGVSRARAARPGTD